MSDHYSLMQATKETTSYDTFIKNYKIYMKGLHHEADQVRKAVKEAGAIQYNHKKSMNSIKKRSKEITNKLQQTYPIKWGMYQMKQYLEIKDIIEGFDALPQEWAMGDDGDKKKSSEGGRKKKREDSHKNHRKEKRL